MFNLSIFLLLSVKRTDSNISHKRTQPAINKSSFIIPISLFSGFLLLTYDKIPFKFVTFIVAFCGCVVTIKLSDLINKYLKIIEKCIEKKIISKETG